MVDSFWAVVDQYINYAGMRSRFGMLVVVPALVLAIILLILAVRYLHRRTTAGVLLTALGLGSAIALLPPGALTTARPGDLTLFGLDPNALFRGPTANFPAVANLL